jgi:hypothetical protein
MLSPVLLYALLAIIDLESEGDLGDDYVLSCGHLAGGNSTSSILLVEFCSGAEAIPIESRCVAYFQCNYSSRRNESDLQDRTPSGLRTGAN